ncbi:hypothetical protein PAEPH01_0150 [Pancytospora epiphaga]|nr:hypothetical protein PAEPH01_0150 [Pancytospora epiphaga]
MSKTDNNTTSSSSTASSSSTKVDFSTSISRKSSSVPSSEIYVTVTRTIEKTITVESPITLYREYTTTVEKEKPIINYKITTVTESSVSITTRTVTQAEETERRHENKSISSLVGKTADSGVTPPGGVSQTVSVECKDNSTSCKGETGTLDSLLKKCTQIGDCMDKLGQLPSELVNISKIRLKEVTDQKTIPPTAQITTKTEHVPFTVTVTTKDQMSNSTSAIPVIEKPKMSTLSEEQPEAYITKTVSIPVYKTLREDPDTETVYLTVTKTSKYHSTKTASKLPNEKSKGKGSRILVNCDLKKSHCKGQNEAVFNNGGNGQPRTIINTIYAIKRTDSNNNVNGL